MVTGISLLLVLVAIYAGSQLFRRGSHDSAAVPSNSAPAADNTNSATQPVAADSSATSSPAAANTAAPKTAPANTSGASSPGQVLERVEPNVSASARASITGKIRVRVNLAVDDSGKVSDAHFITPGPSKYFASRAMEAARRWTFVPPQVNGQAVASKWTLHFEFGRKGTNISAEENSP
jgi:TonB family protein